MDLRVQARLLTAIAAAWLGATAIAQVQTPVEDLTPPVLARDVAPAYPESARLADVEADVVVELDVGVDGGVSNVVAVELTYYTYDLDGAPIDDPRPVGDDPYDFVDAAAEAVARYAFVPARAGDPPAAVAVRMRWRVGFVMTAVDGADEDTEARDGSESDAAATSADLAPEPDRSASEGSGSPAGAAGRDDRAVGGAAPNLTGRVLVRGSRAPLGALRVRAAPADFARADFDTLPPPVETSSDADGRFSFLGLAPGWWSVTVDLAGFYPFRLDTLVVTGETTDATCYVERTREGEYVSRTTAEAPRAEVSRQVLQIEEVQRIPGTNNDAVRVVQNLPGVARPSFGGGDVVVRGSNPEDTGFFLDGMEIPLIYHFGGLRAVVPTEFLEEITFYPGGFSVDYGRFAGGIVDIRSRRDVAARPTGHVDVNLFDSGFYLRAPAADGRFTLELGGRRSYVDAVLAAVASAIPVRFSTAPRYWDYQARVSWRLHDDHTLRLTGIGSDDKIEFVLEDEDDLAPEDRGGLAAHTAFHGTVLSLESRLGDNVTNELRWLVTSLLFGFSFGEEIYFDLTGRESHVRDTVRWEASDRFVLRAGLDLENTPGQIQLSVPRPSKEGEEPLDFEATQNVVGDERFSPLNVGLFLAGEVRPIEALTLLPGVRMEYFDPIDVVAVDPRLAVRGRLSEALTLKGAVTLHHQSPDPEETSRSFGNPDLGLESAIHYIIGTEIQVSEPLSVSVEGFYKDLDGLVSRSADVVGREGETVPEVYDNGGTGRVYGAELLIRHALTSRFFGWVAYTLSRSERLDGGETEYRLFDFDQTHNLTLVGTYMMRKNWSIGGRFRLVTGNPDTPIVGSVYDSDSDTYTRVPGPPNGRRIATFHQLDVRVDKRWVFDRVTASLYLDVQNVYNRRNAEGVQYSYDYSDSARLSGVPLLPALGFRTEF